MLFPDYKSSNGHAVSVYGRLTFLVTSASRKKMRHLVDLEGFEHWKSVCTCESWRLAGQRPCRHIAACFEAIAAWANVSEDLREEFVDRLMFLLQMGQSFSEAILSCLKSQKPETKPGRIYKLKNEITTPAKQKRARRLPAGVHRDHSRSSD